MSNGKPSELHLSSSGSKEDLKRTEEEFDKRRDRNNRFFEESEATIDELKGRLANESFDDLLVDDTFFTLVDKVADIEDLLPTIEIKPLTENMPLLIKSGIGGLEQVKAGVADEEKPEKEAVFQRYHYAILAVTVTGVAAVLLYELLTRLANKQAHDDIKLDEATKNAATTLITKWKDQSDGEFWETMAGVVDTGLVINGKTQPFTIADQVVFLSVTAGLCPATEPFMWDNIADADENAKTIKGFYDKSRKTSDLYRNVVKATYKGKPLQRMWAARQIQTVLGSLIS